MMVVRTIEPRCAVGGRAFYNVRRIPKSPNDAFLRMYPHH